MRIVIKMVVECEGKTVTEEWQVDPYSVRALERDFKPVNPFDKKVSSINAVALILSFY